MAPRASVGNPRGEKRAAAAAKAETAKKAKTESAAVTRKCTSIAQALEEAEGLPANVRSMLAQLCKGTLSEYKDQRHAFQSRFGEMIGVTLNGIQAGLKKSVDDEQAKVGGAEAEKSRRDGNQESANTALEGKKEAAKVCKEALAAAQTGKKAATDALQAAELAQRTGDAELDATAGKKEKLESLKSDMYTPLKEGTLADAAACKKQSGHLVSVLQKDFGFDKTMLNTLPPALSRPPADRGHFDGMVLTQFEEEANKVLAEFEATIREGEPARAARAAAVAAAQAALDAAVAKVAACTSDKSTADAEEKEAEKALKEAAKAVKDYSKDHQAALNALKQNTDTLNAFNDGPLASFGELQARETPPPEPEVPAEPAAAEVPAAA